MSTLMPVSGWFLPYLTLLSIWLAVVTLRCPSVEVGYMPAAIKPVWPQAVGAAALPVLFYWDVTASWWLHDDPSILRHVLEYPVAANLFDPSVWRAFSPANFTPLLPFSFWVDIDLFGLEPRYFYIHQLAALGMAAALGYLLLVRLLAPVVALLVIVLVLLSPPVAELAQSLMTRHYIEGLVALLGAFLAFLRGILTGRRSWLWLGASLYLIACLAKEVFVPAILLFPFLLPAPSSRRAWLGLAPIAGCAALYALWRVWMLGAGNVLAGYGDLHAARSAAPLTNMVTALIPELGLDVWSNLPLVLLLCGLAVWSLVVRRDYRTAGLSFAALIAAWTPLLPLLPNIASRSLLVPAIWLAVVSGIGVQRLAMICWPRTRWSAVFQSSVAAMLGVFAAGQATGWGPGADAERARAEWDFIMQGPPDATLVSPMGEPWYYTNLAWLRKHLGDGLSAPSVCYAPCFCAGPAGSDYFRFASGAMEQYSPDVGACPSLLDAPMAVTLHYDATAGVLHWELFPEDAGRWFYAALPTFKRSKIPHIGKTPFFLKHDVRLQFFFESDSGWTASSEVLRLDKADIGADGALRLAWARSLY